MAGAAGGEMVMDVVIYPCLVVIVTPVVLLLVMRLMGAMLRLIAGTGHNWEPLPPPFSDTGSDRGGGRRRRWRSFDRAGDPSGSAPLVQRTCPNELCRHVNRPGARYCGRCGTRLM